MELWIRSQLKGSLVKINDLRIMRLDKDGFRALIEKEAKEGWCIIANDDPCIGTYQTKERALEILDEIQEMIKPTIITTDYECKCEDNPNDKLSFNLRMEPQKTTIQELSTYVYEMPKE